MKLYTRSTLRSLTRAARAERITIRRQNWVLWRRRLSVPIRPARVSFLIIVVLIAFYSIAKPNYEPAWVRLVGSASAVLLSVVLAALFKERLRSAGDLRGLVALPLRNRDLFAHRLRGLLGVVLWIGCVAGLYGVLFTYRMHPNPPWTLQVAAAALALVQASVLWSLIFVVLRLIRIRAVRIAGFWILSCFFLVIVLSSLWEGFRLGIHELVQSRELRVALWALPSTWPFEALIAWGDSGFGIVPLLWIAGSVAFFLISFPLISAARQGYEAFDVRRSQEPGRRAMDAFREHPERDPDRNEATIREKLLSDADFVPEPRSLVDRLIMAGLSRRERIWLAALRVGGTSLSLKRCVWPIAIALVLAGVMEGSMEWIVAILSLGVFLLMGAYVLAPGVTAVSGFPGQQGVAAFRLYPIDFARVHRLRWRSGFLRLACVLIPFCAAVPAVAWLSGELYPFRAFRAAALFAFGLLTFIPYATALQLAASTSYVGARARIGSYAIVFGLFLHLFSAGYIVISVAANHANTNWVVGLLLLQACLPVLLGRYNGVIEDRTCDWIAVKE